MRPAKRDRQEEGKSETGSTLEKEGEREHHTTAKLAEMQVHAQFQLQMQVQVQRFPPKISHPSQSRLFYQGYFIFPKKKKE